MTCFLTVELVRQEMQPDGKWGPETVVPKLNTSTQPPFPAADANRQLVQGYLNWAVSAAPEILQPAFYQWLKGDVWTLPKEFVGTGIVGADGVPLNLGPNDIRPNFNADQYANMDQKQLTQALAQIQPPLTQAERRAIYAAREKNRQKNRPAPQPRGPTGPRGPGGRGPGPEGDYAPQDNLRPPYGRPPYPGGAVAEDMGEMGGPGFVQPQQANYQQMFPIPTGEFDPRLYIQTPPGGAANPAAAANAGNIVCWAHDVTVQPGKTYRYMMRYKIKNPIYQTVNLGKTKELAAQFAIVSPDSDWTGEVKVPEVVRFFFAGAGIGRGSAQVEVYRYQDGQIHMEKFSGITPGDIIGGERGSVDFTTGVTLVDLRPDTSNRDRTVAWLLSAEGMLFKRDVSSDPNSPDRKKLQDQYNAQNVSANGGAPGAAVVGGAPALINPTR
jgi:hypothetical protein